MGIRQQKQQEHDASAGMADESVSRTPQWKPNTHELMIMGVLSVISMMTALDATVIVTSVNDMAADLDATTTQGIWIGTAYLLSTGVSMPAFASISDIFGRPMLLFVSVALFTIGSIVCATAPGIAQLLAGRSIQGVGGGGIVVLSLVIFTDIVPLRHRPKWYSTVQGAWALGTCAGPIIGGVIAEHTTWRWVFYLMLPFCAFGLISIPLLLTITPRVETLSTKLRRVDWLGMVLFTGSATSFLVALSWGGSQFAWTSAQTLAPLIIGVAGLAANVVWQVYGAVEPLMRLEVWTNFSAIATYLCAAAQGLILFGQLYYAPFYFMAVSNYSPTTTGAALLPISLTLIPASIATGHLISRHASYRWPIWAGWALTTIGCGLTTIWGTHTHVAVWAVTFLVLGFGHGMVLNAQNFAAQAIAGPGDEASAAAMYAFMRHFGSALGVGIGGTAFQNVMRHKLVALSLPAAIAADAEGFLSQLQQSASKAGILEAYAAGFQGVFRVYLALSGVAFFVTLGMKHFDMNKELRTEHTVRENRVSLFLKGQQQHHSRKGSAATVTDGGSAVVLGELSVASSFTKSEGGHKKSLSGGGGAGQAPRKVSFADIGRPETAVWRSRHQEV